MPDYRRYYLPGGTYFFTVNLLERYPNDLLIRNIDLLRSVVRHVQRTWPMTIVAWVVLPDHPHCVGTLPAGDMDFANRWRLIKQGFSKGLPPNERRSTTRIARGERGIWQHRYWEYAIRDDDDFVRHIDYCHINPAKRGHVKIATHWPFSTIHRYVAEGIYPSNWAADMETEVDFGERG